MKHILLKFYLTFFLFVLSNKIFCQASSTFIEVDMDKNDKFFINAGIIPYGQKIVLIGASGNTIFKKIQVESSTANGKQTYDAIISDTDWKVTIGPFQPRQLLTLTIKAIKTLEANDTKLTDILTKALGETAQNITSDLEKSTAGLTQDVFKNLFLKYTKSNLGNGIDNYYLDDNKKVVDNLETIFSFTSANSLVKLLLLSTDVTNLQGSYNVKNQANINLEKVQLEIKSVSQDSEKKKELEKEATKLVSIIKNENEKINKYTDSLNKDIENIISQIKFQQISTVIPLSSVELKASGVEYYAGFDVSTITFDKNLGATGLYFTISPYVFGKFDPELDFSDVRIPNNHGFKNVSLWLKYHISPTVGISFAGNTNVPNTPQLFAGISFRLNRLFKITTGSVFYKNPQNENYIHNFSVGMSLSLNYFGTVLQMLGNATRAVNPN